MLFSEVYGKYYQAVAAVLREARTGELDEGRLVEIVRSHAFAESVLRIPAALRNGSWALVDEGYGTPLRSDPNMPLTLLEKRWMKALLSDPRILLFDPPSEGLEGIEPLFGPDVFVYYDRYLDGDPYSDELYITNFRTVLAALREKRKALIKFRSHREMDHKWVCVPYGLEYSQKDDKFRLLTKSSHGNALTVNMARIKGCELLDPYTQEEYDPPSARKESLTIELVDERNALERAMLHFSHLERATERVGENRYRVTLYYDGDDETEILIRVLSFGPRLRVVAPDSFVGLVRERIEAQRLKK